MRKIKGITWTINELKTNFYTHIIYDDGTAITIEADGFRDKMQRDHLVWFSDIEKEYIKKSEVEKDYIKKDTDLMIKKQVEENWIQKDKIIKAFETLINQKKEEVKKWGYALNVT